MGSLKKIAVLRPLFRFFIGFNHVRYEYSVDGHAHQIAMDDFCVPEKLFWVVQLLSLMFWDTTCPDNGVVRVVVCVRGLKKTIYAGQVFLKLFF